MDLIQVEFWQYDLTELYVATKVIQSFILQAVCFVALHSEKILLTCYSIVLSRCAYKGQTILSELRAAGWTLYSNVNSTFSTCFYETFLILF